MSLYSTAWCVCICVPYNITYPGGIRKLFVIRAKNAQNFPMLNKMNYLLISNNYLLYTLLNIAFPFIYHSNGYIETHYALQWQLWWCWAMLFRANLWDSVCDETYIMAYGDGCLSRCVLSENNSMTSPKLSISPYSELCPWNVEKVKIPNFKWKQKIQQQNRNFIPN